MFRENTADVLQASRVAFIDWSYVSDMFQRAPLHGFNYYLLHIKLPLRS